MHQKWPLNQLKLTINHKPIVVSVVRLSDHIVLHQMMVPTSSQRPFFHPKRPHSLWWDSSWFGDQQQHQMLRIISSHLLLKPFFKTTARTAHQINNGLPTAYNNKDDVKWSEIKCIYIYWSDYPPPHVESQPEPKSSPPTASSRSEKLTFCGFQTKSRLLCVSRKSHKQYTFITCDI